MERTKEQELEFRTEIANLSMLKNGVMSNIHAYRTGIEDDFDEVNRQIEEFNRKMKEFEDKWDVDVDEPNIEKLPESEKRSEEPEPEVKVSEKISLPAFESVKEEPKTGEIERAEENSVSQRQEEKPGQSKPFMVRREENKPNPEKTESEVKKDTKPEPENKKVDEQPKPVRNSETPRPELKPVEEKTPENKAETSKQEENRFQQSKKQHPRVNQNEQETTRKQAEQNNHSDKQKQDNPFISVFVANEQNQQPKKLENAAEPKKAEDEERDPAFVTDWKGAYEYLKKEFDGVVSQLAKLEREVSKAEADKDRYFEALVRAAGMIAKEHTNKNVKGWIEYFVWETYKNYTENKLS